MPSESDLQSYVAVAESAARNAGELLRKNFHQDLEVDAKEAYDIKLALDRESQELITEEILAAFPDHMILGEEGNAGDKDSEFHWVVDPIDGTALFLNGIPSWCISIALLVDGEIQLGLIYDPCNNELFAAQKGLGALLNDKPISIADAQSVKDGMIGVGFSHRVKPNTCLHFLEHLLNDGGMYVRSGSGALSLAYVAAGRLIGYYEPHINAWDCLAGILLIEEAGGWVDDFLSGNGLAQGNPILCGAKPLKPVMIF